VPLTGRSLGLCAITADPHVRRPWHILISAFSKYRPWPPLHVYILTIKQVQLANMEPRPLDDPKNIWASSVTCYSSMGQSGFVVKKRNLPPLQAISALLVCILPHCRLRDWCGNLRKASIHVVCRFDQSASFRIFDSTFYFPHSAFPHFTHSLNNNLGQRYRYYANSTPSLFYTILVCSP